MVITISSGLTILMVLELEHVSINASGEYLPLFVRQVNSDMSEFKHSLRK